MTSLLEVSMYDEWESQIMKKNFINSILTIMYHLFHSILYMKKKILASHAELIPSFKIFHYMA